MKRQLVDFLICPECLPKQRLLDVTIYEIEKDDIWSGYMKCKTCGHNYHIQEGMAVMLPSAGMAIPESQNRYEQDNVLSSYLWTHYADRFGDPNIFDAYPTWAGLLERADGIALDVGCAVGRMSMELSTKFEFVIGLDLSRRFIRTAREINEKGSLVFHLKSEGLRFDEKKIMLSDHWEKGKIEFIIADAMALPFPNGMFSAVTTLNILDKVPKPLHHLVEVNRMVRHNRAQFLFSDPFSWSHEVAKVKDWIGGKDRGRYTGYGKENLLSLLKGEDGLINPSWQKARTGEVWWKIRNHRNHYELIRSEYILAVR